MLDIEKIRTDFPVLSRQVNGKPLVYLDNAATSQKPRSVIQSLVDYYETSNSNVHRAVHALGQEATQLYEDSRAKVANFINAESPENILFVRNTTEGLNLVAKTWARNHLRKGDEVLLSELEHHSNLVPWQQVTMETGATLKLIPIGPDGTLDLSRLDDLLTTKTRVVSLAHMSNALGTINPIKEIGHKAHAVGAKLCIDGAQSVPHLPVDVGDLGSDFLAFSAHKMLGPTGIGVLYVKREILETMEPFLHGGEMVRKVSYKQATWNDLPMRFEAGTPNIADAIGLGAAIDYLKNIGMDRVREHEIQLTQYALNAFRGLEGIQTFGPPEVEVRGGIISFHCNDIHPHDIGTLLDNLGIAIRAGHHCAMPLMSKLGVAATARASFYVYNREEEIDLLVDGLKNAMEYFGHAIRRT